MSTRRKMVVLASLSLLLGLAGFMWYASPTLLGGDMILSNGPWIDPRASIAQFCAATQTTAAVDVSSLLNALTNGVDLSSGKTIKFPPCQIRADEWTIFGQDSLTIAGWGEGVNTTLQKTVIFSCSSNTGGVVTANRSSRLYFKNLDFEIKGSGCTSAKTKNFVGQNSGGTGYTPTLWTFDHISSLSGVTNYVGFDFSFTPNGEQITFISPYMNCQNTTNSTAILFGGANEDLAKISGEPRLTGCYRTVRSQAPNLEIAGGFVSGGDRTIFGLGGAGVYIDSCQRVHVHDVEASDSGAFFRMGAEDGGGGNCPDVTIDNSTIAALNIGAGNHLVNLAVLGTAGVASVRNNVFRISDPAYNRSIIGEETFSALGPQGALIEENNTLFFDSGATAQTITDPAKPFQGGEYHMNAGGSGTRNQDFTHQSVRVPTDFTQGRRSAAFRFYAGHTNGTKTLFDGVSCFAVPVGNGNTTVPYFLCQNDTPNGLTGLPVFAFDGTYSGVNTTQLAQPTLLWATLGTGGSTSYTYAIVAYDPTGHSLASATVTHAASNAVLNSTNYNYMTWNPVAGATKYCIWRTASGGTPSSTGMIGCTNVLNALAVPLDLAMSFNDTGLAGDSSPLPSGNTSGAIIGAHLGSNSATPTISVTAAWGSTVSGFLSPTGNDQSVSVTLTANGSGIAANPQVIVNFASAWTATPGCIASQTGGTGAIANLTVFSRSATAYIFIWNATPVAGSTYEITTMCMGR